MESAMENPPATRFSISQIKEIFKNWGNTSITWIPMINIVSFLGLITHKICPQNKKSFEEPNPISPQNKEINANESKPIFPPEVIMEILSWLPIKSLCQVQLVCKEWRAMVHDRYFTQKHMGRSTDIRYWRDLGPSNYSQDWHNDVESPFSIKSSCDGLLLMMNLSSSKIILWNPATHLFLELPDPQDGTYGFAFSYVTSIGSYKILSIYMDKESKGLGYEVFTPGHSKAWRRLTFPDHVMNVFGYGKIEKVSVVSAGGAAHCVLDIEVGAEIVKKIVTLDMETESFTVNNLPQGVSNDRAICDLRWDDKLAIADIVGEDLHVVKLEDYKKHRWCEKKIISSQTIKKDVKVKKRKIWFWLEDEKAFTYNIETGRMNDVIRAELSSLEGKRHSYRPSLITLEGMVPDTKWQALPKFRPFR